MAVAAVGRPISRVLNAIADKFGSPVSCGGFGAVGGDAID